MSMFFIIIKNGTDYGLILEQIKEDNFFSLDLKINVEITFNPISSHRLAYAASVSAPRFIQVYNRSYTKVQELFARLGGIISALMTFSKLLLYNYTRFKYLIFVQYNTFNLKKSREILNNKANQIKDKDIVDGINKILISNQEKEKEENSLVKDFRKNTKSNKNLTKLSLLNLNVNEVENKEMHQINEESEEPIIRIYNKVDNENSENKGEKESNLEKLNRRNFSYNERAIPIPEVNHPSSFTFKFESLKNSSQMNLHFLKKSNNSSQKVIEIDNKPMIKQNNNEVLDLILKIY